MKDLNVFKKLYKFYGFEIFSDDTLEKENSTSLILTNQKLRFEPCVFNLIDMIC
jgi:hypothetical protein